MKTKIVATIGPKSEDELVLSQMISGGMDIARMNFSHCTFDEYKRRVEIIKRENEKQGKKVLIQMDLQGPRIRVGTMPESGRKLTKGENITFTVEKDGGEEIFIDEPSLIDTIEPGHPIFLSSGEMELVVKEKFEKTFVAEVVRGGMLFKRKGVNVPETKLNFNGLTEKDLNDLKFGLEQGVDYVAVSFVQSGDDVRKVKEIVQGRAKIISKIESAQAVKNIEEIIKESDAIMIARGDLGVEMPMEKVPFIQKNLVRQAHWHNKGVIVATQMMLSMIESKKPTRAEVSDVANAVLDGADAVMLSDETAGGKYPVEAVEMIVRIAGETERMFHETDNLL